MLSSGSGGQPRGAGALVQADYGLESGTSGLRFRRAPLLGAAVGRMFVFPRLDESGELVARPARRQDRGRAAAATWRRPALPNLASVPPKPEAPDRAALANIATALIADRTNAQHAAAAAPIADPSVPIGASPALFGRGTVPPPAPAPPPGAGQASATMAPGPSPGASANAPRRGAGARQGSVWHGGECAACPARRHSAVARRCGGATTCLAGCPAATAEAVGRGVPPRPRHRCSGPTASSFTGRYSAAAAPRPRPLPRQPR